MINFTYGELNLIGFAMTQSPVIMICPNEVSLIVEKINEELENWWTLGNIDETDGADTNVGSKEEQMTLQEEIKNYFINLIEEGKTEIDTVDTHADIQRIIEKHKED